MSTWAETTTIANYIVGQESGKRDAHVLYTVVSNNNSWEGQHQYLVIGTLYDYNITIIVQFCYIYILVSYSISY